MEVRRTKIRGVCCRRYSSRHGPDTNSSGFLSATVRSNSGEIKVKGPPSRSLRRTKHRDRIALYGLHSLSAEFNRDRLPNVARDRFNVRRQVIMPAHPFLKTIFHASFIRASCGICKPVMRKERCTIRSYWNGLAAIMRSGRKRGHYEMWSLWSKHAQNGILSFEHIRQDQNGCCLALR